MPRTFRSAAELLRQDPTVRCFDCRKRMTDSPDHEIWAIDEGRHYCSQCSQAERIAASEAEQLEMNEVHSLSRQHVHDRPHQACKQRQISVLHFGG